MQKRSKYSDIWPIDERAGKPPQGWQGWPEGKRFALVLTHDVETAKGQEKSIQLATLEESFGFCSSFNFVAEGYPVDTELRRHLIEHGFEVGVHGLTHDGNLFKSRNIFLSQVSKINQYLKEWGSVGFRSPSMYHNFELMHHLEIEYDASTFDTDPFEPQPDGIGTIFPFLVQEDSYQKGYVELPYTLPQDFTLFILMEEINIDIWKKKLDWIAKNGGMGLLNAHPDYMNFDGKRLGIKEYPARYYEGFLEYLQAKYEGQYWHVRPKEVASFWTKHYSNNLFYKKLILLR